MIGGFVCFSNLFLQIFLDNYLSGILKVQRTIIFVANRRTIEMSKVQRTVIFVAKRRTIEMLKVKCTEIFVAKRRTIEIIKVQRTVIFNIQDYG